MLQKKFCNSSIKVKNSKLFYLLVATLFLLFATAYVHNNNIAYIVLFFLFSITFFSLIMGRINIKKANFDITTLKIFANQKIKIKLQKKGEFYDILFNNQKELFYLFPKRGLHKIENITLSSDYPFGIAIFSKPLKIEKKLLIYPELKGVSLQKSYFGKSENIDFEGLKSYNNEDIKYIHWASVAKNNLQVKNFSGDGKVEKLIFDINRLNGDKENNISQLALWCYEAFQHSIEFELILDSTILSSKKGFDEIFEKLALY